jgi:RHS repeat-associated protein
VTQWRGVYEAFGRAYVDPDPDGDSQTATLNARLPGQYLDSETEQHYNRFRYYDVGIGKYVSADPLGQLGGMALYTYVADRPTDQVDPHGLHMQDLSDLNFGFGTVDFVLRYWFGGGEPVDLGDVGRGSTFEADPTVKEAVAGFYARLMVAARAAADRLCESCPSATNGTTTASAQAKVPTNVRGSRGLFAVGHSTLFQVGQCSISVDCRTGGYSYSCDSAFAIADSFKDPLDLKEKGLLSNGDLPFSKPYPIEYVFERSFRGAR